MRLCVLVALVLICFSACNKSGAAEDDPRNPEEIFSGQDSVVRSEDGEFWLSPLPFFGSDPPVLRQSPSGELFLTGRYTAQIIDGDRPLVYPPSVFGDTQCPELMPTVGSDESRLVLMKIGLDGQVEWLRCGTNADEIPARSGGIVAFDEEQGLVILETHAGSKSSHYVAYNSLGEVVWSRERDLGIPEYVASRPFSLSELLCPVRTCDIFDVQGLPDGGLLAVARTAEALTLGGVEISPSGNSRYAWFVAGLDGTGVVRWIEPLGSIGAELSRDHIRNNRLLLLKEIHGKKVWKGQEFATSSGSRGVFAALLDPTTGKDLAPPLVAGGTEVVRPGGISPSGSWFTAYSAGVTITIGDQMLRSTTDERILIARVDPGNNQVKSVEAGVLPRQFVVSSDEHMFVVASSVTDDDRDITGLSLPEDVSGVVYGLAKIPTSLDPVRQRR